MERKDDYAMKSSNSQRKSGVVSLVLVKLEAWVRVNN